MKEDNDEVFKAATVVLKYIDPWNEVLHYGCVTYPNCDVGGCGE